MGIYKPVDKDDIDVQVSDHRPKASYFAFEAPDEPGVDARRFGSP
jgi:hypothetical protein